MKRVLLNCAHEHYRAGTTQVVIPASANTRWPAVGVWRLCSLAIAVKLRACA